MRASEVGLLVSVRSAEEATSALRGGADLIDVKEPRRGSLGRADHTTIADVVRVVAGRVPVSAAMGDLGYPMQLDSPPGLSFAKWGLAGWQHPPSQLERMVAEPMPGICRPVLVAYADCRRANSPSPEVLSQLVREWRMAVLVIDTYIKDGSTLLDWIPVPGLALLTWVCQSAGVQVALAGSLGLTEITALGAVCPDWFAVRGAACSGGREGVIDESRVRELKEVIASSTVRVSDVPIS